ncbi:hypothetical protein J5Y04_31290 [Kitasatospora sp. RG8]|uniref:DUF6919 domain-containing protein n=1 Tax=Kitasatospora sp. RG8 TaxID=2820815 RepID=UPI001AE05F8D|nr:hypothetical protein [Kitasatospora sp. RG8]MBP0453993.1 hypothetical protein [Kitasatospora sp. RG8]
MTPTMSHSDERAWQAAASLTDLGELTARWLEGEIASHPGYQPGWGPAQETTATPGLVQALAVCNRAGYLTRASQPGHNGPGADGAHWTQIAAVTGWALDPRILATLRALAHRYSLTLVEHAPALPGESGQGVIVTTRNGRPATIFGRPLAPADVDFIWTPSGARAIAQVQAARQITLATHSPTDTSLFALLRTAFANPARPGKTGH